MQPHDEVVNKMMINQTLNFQTWSRFLQKAVGTVLVIDP
jgi:hypothetical protein